MARTKKEKFVLEDKTYYEDLLWMSMRYCIGRKSIASVTHADNVAKYSYKHLSEERREFNAKDIRNIMNTHFNYYKNLGFDGFNDNICAWEKMAEWIANGNEMKPGMKVVVDAYHNGEVFVESISNTDSPIDWEDEYRDYEPWMKLANALDKKTHKLALIDVNGRKEVEVFPFWRQYTDYEADGTRRVKYEKLWLPLDNYLENPFLLTYMEPEGPIEFIDL